MARIDLTLKIDIRESERFGKEEMKAHFGHLGTHFDVMDKEFPLDNCIRNGRLVDVSHVPADREITVADLGDVHIEAEDFVMFRTGFLQQESYGTSVYFKEHPQLSMELIDHLLQQKVSLIGLDAAGIRRGKEHPPTDQYCADRGVFVVENIDNLELLQQALPESGVFRVYTFPINFVGLTGLPCRVVAEL